MRVVVKISGHLLSPRDKVIDLEYLERLVPVLEELAREHELVVVVGGGALSRLFVRALAKFTENEGLRDLVGIEATRLSASLLAKALGSVAYQRVPESLADVLSMGLERVVVMGGLQPGQSTTTTAAIVAEALGADKLVITTDVDGIYTSDPKKDPSAVKLERVSIDRLKEIFSEQKARPGAYGLLDYLTLSILERSKIPAVVICGDPPENIERALKGERLGTEVVYE